MKKTFSFLLFLAGVLSLAVLPALAFGQSVGATTPAVASPDLLVSLLQGVFPTITPVQAWGAFMFIAAHLMHYLHARGYTLPVISGILAFLQQQPVGGAQAVAAVAADAAPAPAPAVPAPAAKA